jgi:hypothetical protein
VTATKSSLAEVSTSALERIREAIANLSLGTPLTRAGLVSFSAALSGHSRQACLAILDVALAERAKYDTPAPELVWTGPEGHGAMARDTAIVLRELFESARHQVILAGYSFWNATDVLKPLHKAMVDHGVTTTFFVNIDQANVLTSPPELHADRQFANFTSTIWPFGAPYPRVFYDKRALTPGPPFASLHAKCLVVDGQRAFVSSANFTTRGQERNIEVGVLIENSRFATHLSRQWLGLVDVGHVLGWQSA